MLYQRIQLGLYFHFSRTIFEADNNRNVISYLIINVFDPQKLNISRETICGFS